MVPVCVQTKVRVGVLIRSDDWLQIIVACRLGGKPFASVIEKALGYSIACVPRL